MASQPLVSRMQVPTRAVQHRSLPCCAVAAVTSKQLVPVGDQACPQQQPRTSVQQQQEVVLAGSLEDVQVLVNGFHSLPGSSSVQGACIQEPCSTAQAAGDDGPWPLKHVRLKDINQAQHHQHHHVLEPVQGGQGPVFLQLHLPAQPGAEHHAVDSLAAARSIHPAQHPVAASLQGASQQEQADGWAVTLQVQQDHLQQHLQQQEQHQQHQPSSRRRPRRRRDARHSVDPPPQQSQQLQQDEQQLQLQQPMLLLPPEPPTTQVPISEPCTVDAVTAAAITRHIKHASSLQHLQQLLSQHASSLNAIHVSAALHALVRLASQLQRSQHQHEQQLAQLGWAATWEQPTAMQQVQARRSRGRPPHRLGPRRRGMQQPREQQQGPVAPLGNDSSPSSNGSSHSSLNDRDGSSGSPARQHEQQLPQHDATQWPAPSPAPSVKAAAARAARTGGHHQHQQQQQRRLRTLQPDKQLQHLPEQELLRQLVLLLSSLALRQLPDMRLREITSAMSCLLQLGAPLKKSYYVQLMAQAQHHFKDPATNAWALAQLLYCVARAGMRRLRPDWAGYFLAAVAARPEQLDVRCTARLLHALAWLGHTPPEDVSQLLLVRFVAQLEAAHPQDVSVVLWAAVRLQLPITFQQVDAICEQARRLIPLLDGRELGLILWSLAHIKPQHHSGACSTAGDETSSSDLAHGPSSSSSGNGNGNGSRHGSNSKVRRSSADDAVAAAGGSGSSSHSSAPAASSPASGPGRSLGSAAWQAAALALVQEQLVVLHGHSLALMVYSLGRLQWRPKPEVLDATLEAVQQAGFPRLTAQGMALLIYGLVQLGHAPSRTWLHAFHAHLTGMRAEFHPSVMYLVKASFAALGFQSDAAAVQQQQGNSMARCAHVAAQQAEAAAVSHWMPPGYSLMPPPSRYVWSGSHAQPTPHASVGDAGPGAAAAGAGPAAAPSGPPPAAPEAGQLGCNAVPDACWSTPTAVCLVR